MAIAFQLVRPSYRIIEGIYMVWNVQVFLIDIDAKVYKFSSEFYVQR